MAGRRSSGCTRRAGMGPLSIPATCGDGMRAGLAVPRQAAAVPPVGWPGVLPRMPWGLESMSAWGAWILAPSVFFH